MVALSACREWALRPALALQLEEDAVDFEKEQKRLAEVHRKAWEEDIQEKRRLEKMTEAKDQLAHEIMTRRAAVFARLQVLHFTGVATT